MPLEGDEQAAHAPQAISSLIGETIGDGKRWARAEIAYYKAVAGERAGDAGIGAGLAIGAALLTQAALIAGLVGLVLTLTPRFGAGAATLLVVFIVLAIAAILGFLALVRFRRLRAPLSKGEP
jgi:hypothetical protein